MNNKFLIFIAIALFLCTVFAYSTYFYLQLEYELSSKTEVWAQFGDYFGGVLNPAFTFLSLVLLIKSLTVQHKANRSLIEEINDRRMAEKLKSFEELLFKIIDSQRSLFDSFELVINGASYTKSSAVITLENVIEELSQKGATKKEIENHINGIDDLDSIYELVRCFSNTIKVVNSRLSEDSFESNLRSTYIKLFIQLTQFSHLRLILICMQYLEYEFVDSLKKDEEFTKVLDDIGIKFNPY